jgi:glycosyltransferase involved in cell wall biosynthesis
MGAGFAEYQPRVNRVNRFAIVDLSVVIPCSNEAASLSELLTRVDRALSPPQSPFEVIVVNDGGTDESARILGDSAATRPWLKVVNPRRNNGQTAALMAGPERAASAN